MRRVKQSNPLSYIRQCLRPDPQVWHYEDEEESEEEEEVEEEEAYRTVYVKTDGEDIER